MTITRVIINGNDRMRFVIPRKLDLLWLWAQRSISEESGKTTTNGPEPKLFSGVHTPPHRRSTKKEKENTTLAVEKN
jgi:hypothetical protein